MRQQSKSGSKPKRKRDGRSFVDRRREQIDKAKRQSDLYSLLHEFFDARARKDDEWMHHVGKRLSSKYTKDELNSAARTVEAERRARSNVNTLPPPAATVEPLPEPA